MSIKEIKSFEGLWRSLWETFHKGALTKTPPVEEGLYPVWSRDGTFRGYIEVFEAAGDVWYSNRSGTPSPALQRCGLTSNNPHKVHVGWWWDTALPQMPSAPDWDEADTDEMTQLEEASDGS